MLEEFFKKNMDFFEKLKSYAYDATVGLARAYQDKTIALAKIHAAQFYLKVVRIARRQIMALAGAVFALVIVAVGLVVVPVTMVLLSDWSRQTKLLVVGFWGILTVLLPLLVFFHFFSEKQWLKFSKSTEFLEDAIADGK